MEDDRGRSLNGRPAIGPEPVLLHKETLALLIVYVEQHRRIHRRLLADGYRYEHGIFIPPTTDV